VNDSDDQKECMPALECESAAVHSYLNILQSVTSRMASNSAGCKSWCITLTSAIIVVLLNSNRQEYVYVAVIPVIMFMLLDCYYLAMERSFRGRYNNFIQKLHANQATKSDLFVVSPEEALKSSDLIDSIKSISVYVFYLSLTVIIVGLCLIT
jgi:hypothetical protein